MIYMKHSQLGNANFPDSEQAKREAEGWTKWPRTKEQKAAGSPVISALPSIGQILNWEEKEKVSRETLPPSRAELETAAAQLEIKVDGRWSNARLAEEIRKVEDDLNS